MTAPALARLAKLEAVVEAVRNNLVRVGWDDGAAKRRIEDALDTLEEP